MADPTYQGEPPSGQRFTGSTQPQTVAHAAEPIAAAPSPSLLIPYPRDPDFVCDGEYLNQINKRSADPTWRFAFVGPPGVGKSHLAIEYCYRLCELYPQTSIFWICATSPARVEQSYREIAESLALWGRMVEHADVIKLVHDWLLDEKNGTWLVVLDGLDQSTILSQPVRVDNAPSSKGSMDQCQTLNHLPVVAHGSVLVTCETPDAIQKFVREGDHLTIRPMSVASAVRLFSKKLVDNTGGAGMEDLARVLGCVPLALVQAAAYIRRRGPEYSVRRYLEEYHDNNASDDHLLSRRCDLSAQTAEEMVAKTVAVSLQHLHKICRSAADLISLMSFFDPQGVPAELLYRRYPSSNVGEKAENEKTDHPGTYSDAHIDPVNPTRKGAEEALIPDDGFKEDLAILMAYELVEHTTDLKVVMIHTSVQSAVQRWLQHQNQLEQWKRSSIRRLNENFPMSRFGPNQIHKWHTLCCHAKRLSDQPPQARESLDEWAKLLAHCEIYAGVMHRLEERQQFHAAASRVVLELFGTNHPRWWDLMYVEGIFLHRLGQVDAAKKLITEVFEARKMLLGSDHIDTMVTLYCLGSIHFIAKRYMETRKLFSTVISYMKKTYGEADRNTLLVRQAVISLHKREGTLKKATEEIETLAQLAPKVFGDQHQVTFRSIDHLLWLRLDQKQWQDAERLSRETMHISERWYGPDHENTLNCIHNLSFSLQEQGKFDEAIALKAHLAQTRKRLHGVESKEYKATLKSLKEYQREQRIAEEPGLLGSFRRLCNI